MEMGTGEVKFVITKTYTYSDIIRGPEFIVRKRRIRKYLQPKVYNTSPVHIVQPRFLYHSKNLLFFANKSTPNDINPDISHTEI